MPRVEANCPCGCGQIVEIALPVAHRLVGLSRSPFDEWVKHDKPSHAFLEATCEHTGRTFHIHAAPFERGR